MAYTCFFVLGFQSYVIFYCRFLEWCFQGCCCIVHSRHIGVEYIFNWGESSWLKMTCQGRSSLYNHGNIETDGTLIRWPNIIGRLNPRKVIKRDTMEVFTINHGLYKTVSPRNLVLILYLFPNNTPLKWVCLQEELVKCI